MALDVNLQRISGIYQDMKPSGNFMTDLTFPEEDSTMSKSFVPMDRTGAPKDDGIDNIGFQGSESDDEDSASDDIEVNSQYSTDDDEVFKTPDSKPAEANGHVAPTVFEGRRKSSKKKQHAWDVFRVGSNDNVSDAEIACWGTVNVITRVVMCSFMFAIVLVTAFASKLTLFYMIANLFPPTTDYNGNLKTLSNTLVWDDAVKTTEITWIWSILIVIAAPYLFVVCKCFWRLCFKKTRPIVCTTLLAVFCTETLHSVGLFVFVLVVLPSFEPVTGSLLCLTVVVIPGLLKVFYPQRTVKQVETSNKYGRARVLNVFAFLCNVGAIGLWCFHVYENEKETGGHVMLRKGILIALVVLCPLFISLSWWENYVRHGKEDDTGLPKLKGNIRKQRTKISVLVYLWKIILTIIILPSILFTATCKVGDGDKCVRAFFFQISNSDSATVYTLMGPRDLTDKRNFGVLCFSYMPFMFAVINILFNIICFKVGKSACKIVAQRVSYALPLALSTPLVIGVMLGLYSQTASFSVNQCTIPFPHWPNGDPGKIIEVIGSYWPVLVAGALSCLSFLLISNHVWSPSKERLISTDKLFVQHLYCGALIDQSLMLNRRRTDEEFKPTEDNQENNRDVPIPTFSEENFDRADEYSVLKKDDTPMIFMCATMWHESENEMTQILKSIFRMDDDQCARRHLQMFLGIKDPDYYEFEAHIFFDDAFEPHGDGEYEYRVNDYVRQLVSVMDVAASSVHNSIMKIPPPTRIPTPYGGRLIWMLPGGNKIIAHLKDKAKIRHRKRWSQVMYMYYFLGHELLTMNKTRKQKRIISENTFLLALDGDVDFQPAAVQLLVDRMKKNHSVGAACGRIHPIGSGPMVWYQQFEYAISHWLQKAAENVLGCVLCSPGCFSLFRGSALMDDNVMRRYTTPPTEPEHYVQYDQGEDRWLCTLLLQQGYKVEYVAASDALTYAPEGFYEFYNQRRRWSPSTMANIIDLLLDWKNVTRKNEDISKLYVAYQMFLMASSILTPGTIFLMILGAISSAFPAITPTIAMVVNLIPVIGMVVLCFVARTQIQLAYAAIVSTIYSLLMMVVLVGLLKEAVEEQFCSVTTIFLLIVAGIFVISALLHPQEFYCVLHGFLYFLAIPSMSMLLMIYSLGNLHVVSWGTRETKIAAPPTAKKEAEQPKRNAVQTWLDKLGGGDSGGTSDYTFSCGNLMRCMCCPQPSGSSEDMRFRAILDRLDDIESRMTATSHVTTAGGISDTSDPPDEPFSNTAGIFEGAVDRVNPAFEEEKQRVRDELKDPYWIHDEAVREGPLEFLQTDEVSFWRDFIDRYLLPLESNKDHEKQIQNALLELRNKVCLAFLLVNALFVTIVYVLTEVNASDGSLSIPLPNCPHDKPGKGKIEPISFAFTAVFGVMLVTQFICMLFHRLSTFLHITASTEIRLKSRIQKKLSGAPDTYADVTRDEGLKLVKEMQQAPDVSDTMSVVSQVTTVSADDLGETIGEKKGKELWRKLGRRRRGEYHNQTLGRNFLKNFEKLQSVISDDDKMSMTGKTSMLNGMEEKDPKEEKISHARNVFHNRFQRQSLHTIVALAQNDKRKQEIQRRATLVEHMRKKKRMTKFQEIAQRALMNEKRETGNGTGAKKGRVNFGDLAKLAVINEKTKRLEEEEIKQEEKDEAYEMQKSPVRKGMYDKRKPGVIKEEVEDRLEANGSKAAKIDAENGQEWPEEDTYYMNPGEVSQNKTNISNVDVLF